MKILVTGKNGQVGTALQQNWPSHWQGVFLSHSELPIDQAETTIQTVNQGGFDLVINAAAYTAVDKAESDTDAAFAANAEGPKNLAQACAFADIPLFHLSTDYVFDGTKAGPYHETDPVAPLGVYGASKRAGEEAIIKNSAKYLILRTSWVYAAHGQNFVRTMLRLGGERPELRIVADQVGAPTSADDIARALLELATIVEQRQRTQTPIEWGLYHMTAQGETSWYGFAEAIFAEREALTGQKPPRLVPIATSDYPTPAKRPANSRLSCEKLSRHFRTTLPPWREGLNRVMIALHDKGEF